MSDSVTYDPLPPPGVLEAAGRRVWTSMMEAAVFDVAEAIVLETACKTADVIARLEGIVAVDGVLASGSQGQQKIHPALVELRLSRAMLTGLLAKLAPSESSGKPFNASEHGRAAARARWSGVPRTGTRSNPRP